MNQLTIPSRSLDVWRRLYTRYSLEPFPASVSPDVSKTIIPVTQADELLKAPTVQLSGAVVTETGNVNMFTVPNGERWTFYGYETDRVSGDRNINAVSVNLGGAQCAIAEFTAAASHQLLLPQRLILTQGSTIVQFVTGGATDGTWQMRAIVEVETGF